MKILFLGTGAADWANKPEEEMKAGERRFSSLIIDSSLLVDVCPQSYGAARTFNAPLDSLTDVLIGHTHSDHWSREAFLSFASHAPLRVHCHTDAVPRLGLDGVKGVEVCPHEVGDVFDAGGYKVTALRANHLVASSREVTLHYVIEKDKKLFYGCDGAWFLTETWEHIKKTRLDCAILDSTVGDVKGDFRIASHNTLDMTKLLVEGLHSNRVMEEGGVIVADHLAMTLHPDPDTTRGIYAELGMIMAEDGMELEI